MTDTDFRVWLISEKHVFDAFGHFVVSKIKERVLAELPESRKHSFFKIEPSFRTKDIQSALKKQSKKAYADPQVQMTDLVGVRFVVLLRSDIALVEYPLKCGSTLWTVKRDREPKTEADSNPDAFRYQSVHYIVRNTEDRTYNGITIPADTACEVQIRTLLQHAYAELGHDRIYKGDAVVPPSVHRIVARSMALMETTDHLFCEAVEELNRINKDMAGWCAWLDSAYRSVGAPPSLESHDDEDAIRIIETFMHLLKAADEKEVRGCFQSFIDEHIKKRPRLDDLFSRPVVMLVYWLLSRHSVQTSSRWPLPKFRDDLEMIAADLGIALS